MKYDSWTGCSHCEKWNLREVEKPIKRVTPENVNFKHEGALVFPFLFFEFVDKYTFLDRMGYSRETNQMMRISELIQNAVNTIHIQTEDLETTSFPSYCLLLKNDLNKDSVDVIISHHSGHASCLHHVTLEDDSKQLLFHGICSQSSVDNFVTPQCVSQWAQITHI